MKNILYLFLGLLLLSSCEEFLDVNENPNLPISSNLPISAKLSGALVSTVNQETIQLNQLGAFWGGYWSTNNDGANLFFDLKTYNGPGIRSQRDGIPVWENGYNNILYFRLIEKEAAAEGIQFYVGVSKIMQGWLFLRLVDVYNNIPFDQAAEGNQFLNPTYERGEDVYRKSIDLISEGILALKAANNIPANSGGDLIFQGDKGKWIQFANTIKLRGLIRQSEKGDPAYIRQELGKIQQEGSGFLGEGLHAAVNPGYLNTAGKMNPFWEQYYRDVQGNATANYQNIRPTTYLIDQYISRNDPRLEKLYVAINGSYHGAIFGNPDAGDAIYARERTSAFKGPRENNGQPTGLFKSINQSSILLGSFESLFLQAEAAERGWIEGSAKIYYELAIKESFIYLTLDLSSFEIYNAQSNVNLDGAENKLERIINQKWLAMNSINSIEAWNDYRRLGLPHFPATAASGITGRPLRLMYPETERGTNLEQVLAQDGDMMLVDKVWWNP